MLLVVFLMMAILTGVRWNLSVVLIYISFMARDGEHFIMLHSNLTVAPNKNILAVPSAESKHEDMNA
jgi:hypothetical protein